MRSASDAGSSIKKKYQDAYFVFTLKNAPATSRWRHFSTDPSNIAALGKIFVAFGGTFVVSSDGNIFIYNELGTSYDAATALHL